jgi:exonuclease VII large subunit
MVSDRSLERISLVLVISGIIALYFIAQTIEPQNVKISRLTGDFLGKTVSINGTLKSNPYFHKDGHVFLTIKDGKSEITAVFFSNQAKKIPELKNLTKGMNVTITGSVNEYQNELEIVGKEIKLIG